MKTLKAYKFFFGIVATFFLFFLFFTFFSRIARAAAPGINTQPRVAIIAIESNRMIDRSILIDRIPVINVNRSIIG